MTKRHSHSCNGSTRRIWAFAAALFYGAYAQAAQANDQDQKTYDLDKHVVAYNRTELAVSEIGSSAAVISREELEQRKPRSVYDALGVVPGVNIRRTGGPGAVATVNVRGLNAEQTLILVDGVRLTNPASANAMNLDFIPVENIERIEVLRGAHSVVYGADAIGGVINVITKTPERNEPVITLDAMGGSFQTWRGQASFQGKEDKLSYSGFLSQFETKGFSRQSPREAEADDFEETHFDGQLGYDFSDFVTVRGVYKYTKTQSDFDGFNAPNDVFSLINEEQHLFLGEATATLLDGIWETKPIVSYTSVDTVIPGGGFDVQGDAFNMDWQNQFYLHEHLDIVSGIEYEELTGESIGNFDESIDTTSFYLLGRFSWDDSLFIDLGGRVDNSSDFGTENTWRIAGSYHYDPTLTRIHSSYGTSFKAPNVSQLFNPNFGSTTLKAERGRSFDIGVDQVLWEDKVTTGITYFYNDVDDLIQFDTTLPGPFGGRFNNIAQARTQGYESYVRVTPIQNVSVTLNYTWLDALDKQNNADLARRPHHTASGILNWLTLDDKLNLNLTVRYVGERFDRGGETRPMGGFTVWDASASYQWDEHLQIYAKVDNLFDRDYEDIQGFSTPELSGYLGVRYAFW